MNITIPKDLRSCSPEVLSKWMYLSSGKLDLDTLSGKLDFRVQVVSIFSGMTKERLYNVDLRDINTIFLDIIEMLEGFSTGEPSGVVTIGEQVYLFDKDFRNITTGQIIDMKLIDDVISSPLDVLSLIYIEEGMKYNQVDDRNRVMNPKDKRMKVFADFPGDEFLNVFAFFLSNYEKQKNAIYALNMAQAQVTMTNMKNELMNELKEASGTSGRQTS